MKTMIALAVLMATTALAQGRPPGPPPVPPGPPPHLHGLPGLGPSGGVEGFGAPGIPPQVAQRLGLPAETVKKVRELSLDANEQLISLEADLKRAQLDLERAMLDANPDEAKVLGKLDAIAKAELAVRKNRVGLMLKIRKALGPDAWNRLAAEMPPPVHGGGNRHGDEP